MQVIKTVKKVLTEPVTNLQPTCEPALHNPRKQYNEALSRSPNVSKQVTDCKTEKRQNGVRLSQSMIIARAMRKQKLGKPQNQRRKHHPKLEMSLGI